MRGLELYMLSNLSVNVILRLSRSWLGCSVRKIAAVSEPNSDLMAMSTGAYGYGSFQMLRTLIMWVQISARPLVLKVNSILSACVPLDALNGSGHQKMYA